MNVTVDHPRDSSDWAQIRRICCLTGAPGGSAIERERWPFFAEQWVGPYQKLAPDWAYVLRAEGGKVVGYLLAAPDAKRFERARRFRFDLPLAARVAARRFPLTVDSRKFLRRRVGLEPDPQSAFSAATWDRLHREFPAELHINLDAEARGRRLGDRLIEELLRDLHAMEIPGAHLVCGEGPLKFYRRVGFGIVERAVFAGKIPLYALGRGT